MKYANDKTETPDQHQYLIHRNQIDDINEFYVRHHVEREKAKTGWASAVIVWGVVFGFFYFFLQDIFFPQDYWIFAWIGVSIVSGLITGFDMGVRIR